MKIDFVRLKSKDGNSSRWHIVDTDASNIEICFWYRENGQNTLFHFEKPHYNLDSFVKNQHPSLEIERYEGTIELPE